MTDALKEAMAGQTDAEKAFEESLTEYQTEYLNYQRDLLKNIQEAKELGTLTGDLSSEEIEGLDTLEANAIQQLTTQVNKQLEDVMGKEVASLVNRGVLQGAIGAETMARLGEKATDIIAKGTTDIESTRISQELGMREAAKDRELRQLGLLQGSGTSAMGLGQSMEQFEKNLAMSGSQYATSLGQNWELGKLNAAAGLYGGAANRAMQQAITNRQAQASERSGFWGAIGTGVGLATLLA